MMMWENKKQNEILSASTSKSPYSTLENQNNAVAAMFGLQGAVDCGPSDGLSAAAHI